jgi:hypothetical protein
MNEKEKTCHDCHGFKWKNINIDPIFTIFLCNLTPFLAHWIVTTPNLKLFKTIEKKGEGCSYV